MEKERTIRVLIIEDDPLITCVYEDELSESDNIEFVTTSFETMNEGLEAMQKNEYDVLLLDLNLPDSDYLQTIESLPGITAKLPVVIMTSTSSELLALKAVNLGSQDFLNKAQIEKGILIRSILYAVERHQLNLQLKREKQKSEDLLNNILPVSIADELKHHGKVNARFFDDVSVMFVDFVNFTSSSSSMNPEEIVRELHTCFSEFDAISEKYGIEKIKTIGDAYMCVGGIPVEDKNHLKHLLQAATEMIEFSNNRFQENNNKNLPAWQARIGIHRGAAVAGVVGTRKFTYDIWGDTVNTASRMESNSASGRINVSDAVYESMKNEFQFEFRGEIEAKGKGKIKMYFLK
ncbi:MAG: adenylate/guanylate cyclase domain-containing protein [Bacteroidia bacterium]